VAPSSTWCWPKPASTSTAARHGHHHQRQSARPDAAHARRRDRHDSRHQPLRETAIHWHGIILPFQMDGVPGSFAGIAPGETFTYRFKVEQSGTYWYHSHSACRN
jgi:FtsP/CotA-like multicopper oxidase with cupredoxin domain